MGGQLLMLLLPVSWFRSGWKGALFFILDEHSPFWNDHF